MKYKQDTKSIMTQQGKRDGEHVVARRMRLLYAIPVARQEGSGVSIEDLTVSLNAAGFSCHRRTVERDLETIACAPEWKQIGVGLVSWTAPDDRRRKLWAHNPDSKALLFSVLLPEEAMLMRVLEQELKVLVPSGVQPVLSRLRNLADDVLALPSNRGLAQFRERIRVLPDGPLQIAPKFDTANLAIISEALLQGIQLDLQYWSSSVKKIKHYQLHPVGLVKQGLFFWLLAVKDEHAHSPKVPGPVQTFRVDRIRSAATRSHDVVARSLPSLDAVLESGGIKFFPTDHVQVRLRFADTPSAMELANNYRETPLSHDQHIVNCGSVLELTATVRLSHQLKWMLQGQASHVKVVAPQRLHDDIARAVKAAAVLYG